MTNKTSEDFDPSEIGTFRTALGARTYVEEEPADNTEEFVQFSFLGSLDGRDVIFDTAMYTLRLHHESELYDIAEQRAKKQFPDYKRINWGESDELAPDGEEDPLEEQIGLFMAEVILELEEEGSVKVQEHVDMEAGSGTHASLDVGLNRAKITPEIIEKFIREFNSDTLKLDETLYSFESQDEED